MIKSCKFPTPWPYHPVDVDNELFEIPGNLQRFMLGLLTGSPETKEPSNRVTMLMKSFSQDFIYAVSCGQQKSPKHVLLPYTIMVMLS